MLNHGDFWCNNFMFKYKNASEVEDVCFVDFQLPKYGKLKENSKIFNCNNNTPFQAHPPKIFYAY